MKILITGGLGQLAKALKHELQNDHEIYLWDLPELDFALVEDTLQKVVRVKPDLVIHCGAYTDVRGCELYPTKAYQVNWLGTRNVALAALQCGATMVYISTDYVFDGAKREPYLELDLPNPLSVYGKSKLAGEEVVRQLVNAHYIVRTAWLYSENGNNFVQKMLQLAQKKEEISVVYDQIGSPTFARELAAAIRLLISRPYYGTYHITNRGSCSWYELARAIFDYEGIHIKVNPITTEELGDVVARPLYSVLDILNFETTYHTNLQHWKNALHDCLKSLNRKERCIL